MKPFPLGSSLIMLAIIVIFGTIYQHNLIIKKTYDIQRLNYKNNKLQKEKDVLLKHYGSIKNLSDIKKWALSHGMIEPDAKKIKKIETTYTFAELITSSSTQGVAHGSSL